MNKLLDKARNVADDQRLNLAKNRVAILNLETKLKQMDNVAIPTNHYFSHDVYGREIEIPKDTLLVGKIHKYKNLSILSKGRLLLISENGVEDIEAPYTYVADSGIKRAFYAYTDCIWTVMHGTSETDIDKIEDCYIAKDYSEVEGILDQDVQMFTRLKEEYLCGKNIT